MKRRIARYLCAIALCFSGFAEIASPQNQVAVKGIVFAPSTGKGIQDIQIDIGIGDTFHQKFTEADGTFAFENLPNSVRFVIDIYDPRHEANGRLPYENLRIGYVGANQPLHVLNIVLEPDAATKITSIEARSRLNALNQILSRYGPRNRAWAAVYVQDVFVRHQEPTARFGEEMTNVIEKIQSQQNLYVTNSEMVKVEDGLMSVYSVPELSTTAKFASLIAGKSNLDAKRFTFSATSTDILVAKPPSRESQYSATIGKLLASEFQLISLPARTGNIKSLTAAADRPEIISGGSEGTVNLSKRGETARTVHIGSTPVAATAMSGNGDRWAAVFVDGTYVAGEVASDRPAWQGRLPYRFPNDVEFSPDGRFLCIGAGLAGIDCGFVIVDYAAAPNKPQVFPAEHAIDQIAFLSDGQKLLTKRPNNTLTAWDFSNEQSHVTLSPTTNFLGVTAFGVPQGGNRIGVSSDKYTLPAVFRVDEFLNPATNKSNFGIEFEKP